MGCHIGHEQFPLEVVDGFIERFLELFSPLAQACCQGRVGGHRIGGYELFLDRIEELDEILLSASEFCDGCPAMVSGALSLGRLIRDGEPDSGVCGVWRGRRIRCLRALYRDRAIGEGVQVGADARVVVLV